MSKTRPPTTTQYGAAYHTQRHTVRVVRRAVTARGALITKPVRVYNSLCGTENKQEGDVHEHRTWQAESQRQAGSKLTESNKITPKNIISYMCDDFRGLDT